MEYERALVLSYKGIRKTIGFLGLSFPFVLSIGAYVIFKTELQSSLSSYYHTGMRDVFVGTLCVIGFFLFAYRGYDIYDNTVGNFACLFAVGTALFPASSDKANSEAFDFIGLLHLVFAGLFFSMLIIFSLFLFTKTDPNKKPSKEKLNRNKIYKLCGYTMIDCILLIGLYYAFGLHKETSLEKYNPVFWLETVAILAFSISWTVKGQALLKDKPESQDLS